MSSTTLRASRALRATRPRGARFASTQEAAQAAKAKASSVAGDAQAKASAAAGDAQAKAADFAQLALGYGQAALGAVQRALGPVGQRLGAALGGYREPLLYNFAVARELAKQVYAAERLAPPTTFGSVANAYGALWQRARSPAYWREIAQNGEWKKVGIYGLEAYGIYKIGEILGRRSLIGYSTH